MKKNLLLLFIFINLLSVSISASKVNIVNSASEQNYSYSIEYLDENDARTVVTTNFTLADQITLDSSSSGKTTNPFYIVRSGGNKEHIQEIIIDIKPENFRNSLGELQSFYPSVSLYDFGATYSDSTYFGVSYTGDNSNGLEFGINIPALVHNSTADIGAFYLYYNPDLFEDVSIVAGHYTSNIEINISTDM